MDYQILFQKSDTIANGSSLVPGTTTFLLTSGNFGTHTDYYVVDYDVPALAEVVELTVNGTTATVISRGRDGTAQSSHSQNAKIGSMWTTSHQAKLQSGVSNAVPAILTTEYTPLTGPLTLTGTVQAIPSILQTIVVGAGTTATVVALGVTDIDSQAGATTGVQLTVDGVGALSSGSIIFVTYVSHTRATVSSNWSLVLQPGTHTITMSAVLLGGTAGSVVVNDTHTKLTTMTYTKSS